MIISTGFDPSAPMSAKAMKAEAQHIFFGGGRVLDYITLFVV